MVPQVSQTPDPLKRAIVSPLTNEGTSAERLIDAYEGLSAALRQLRGSTGQLAKKARRLERDLNRYASERGLSTIMAIALMDEPAVHYWTTRVLGLAAEPGNRMRSSSGGRPWIVDE
jgi:hypothetical protein